MLICDGCGIQLGTALHQLSCNFHWKNDNYEVEVLMKGIVRCKLKNKLTLAEWLQLQTDPAFLNRIMGQSIK